MKNQYFGDVNDYVKYGLLRILAGGGSTRIGVCWMLTPDDNSGDGRKRTHFVAARQWRMCDPDLFDQLADCDVARIKDVAEIEQRGLIRAARYYQTQLGDSRHERQRYFLQMFETFATQDLVFFDPDTGIGGKSVKAGCRDSAKYLYWNEICDAFARGFSLLIYQHFHRTEHGQFVKTFANDLQEKTKAAETHAFRTAHVVFLLALQNKHREQVRPAIECISRVWGDHIQHLGPTRS